MSLFSMKTGKKVHNRTIYNAGYTLIELIVVMAIMAIMTGGFAIGISLMFSRDAQSVAVILDDELAELRMLSMSKAGEYIMTIHTTSDYSKDNKIVIDDGDVSTAPQEISLNKNVKITVEQKNGAGSYSTSGGEDIEIIIDKGNGSVKTVRTAGTSGDIASGVYVFSVSTERKVATVTLVAATGRHYTEK